MKKIIKDISNNVIATDNNKTMKIIVYYRNCTVKTLIMKNNITRKNYKLGTSTRRT